LRIAPRCGEKNPPGSGRCGKCGLILDRELAMKMEEEARKGDEELLDRIKRLESAVASLLGQ
jgi:ribosomal protein L40E